MKDATRADATRSCRSATWATTCCRRAAASCCARSCSARRVEATKRTILGTILAERVLDAVALGVILVVLAYDLLRGCRSRARRSLLVGAGARRRCSRSRSPSRSLRYRERLVFVLRALAPMAQPSRRC